MRSVNALGPLRVQTLQQGSGPGVQAQRTSSNPDILTLTHDEPPLEPPPLEPPAAEPRFNKEVRPRDLQLFQHR